jgi:DNA repair protein RecN (Recombination protein N)
VHEGLKAAVEGELRQLHMKETRFEAVFEEDSEIAGDSAADRIKSLGPHGFDRVAFMLSTNPGEDLKPLSTIVSGGELSRIMLAFKTILAKNASVETVVFDEVDSGISGATAEVVGEKLVSLAVISSDSVYHASPSDRLPGRKPFFGEKRDFRRAHPCDHY